MLSEAKDQRERSIWATRQTIPLPQMLRFTQHDMSELAFHSMHDGKHQEVWGVERAETVEEKRGEKQGEILAAAVRVLARDGIAETTTRKIAAEAGVNQAMLRYYFGSKDELLFAVLQEMMRQTREIARVAASAHEDVRTAIAESLKAFWAHVEAAPELQVMQYELTLYALRTPSSAWLAKQQYDGYSAVVEMLLQEAFAARQIPAVPYATLARFIIAGLDGLILQFISDRNPERARQDLDSLIAATIALVEAGQDGGQLRPY